METPYESTLSLKKSSFKKNADTIIMVHGWNTNSEGNWQDEATKNLRDVRGAVNIINVDWRSGAQILGKSYLINDKII